MRQGWTGEHASASHLSNRQLREGPAFLSAQGVGPLAFRMRSRIGVARKCLTLPLRGARLVRMEDARYVKRLPSQLWPRYYRHAD